MRAVTAPDSWRSTPAAAGAGGEAGQVLAVFVAGVLRHLADFPAGDLKEIEQIVMQIHSEPGSLMLAVEEGTLPVMEGAKLAGGAKRAVGEIIQMANCIEVVAISIAVSAAKQTETARAVALVMPAVEFRAQETAQEAQRASGALQNLVGVARDLLTSAERFRADAAAR